MMVYFRVIANLVIQIPQTKPDKFEFNRKMTLKILKKNIARVLTQILYY